MKRVLLHSGLFLAPLLTATAATQSQDFTYTTNNGTLTITGYFGPGYFWPGGAVTVPSTINGQPVVSIGISAFITNLYLTSITIPSTVTNVGYQAFSGCSALTNVALAEGLTTIEDFAFSYCSDLVSLTIPSSVTSIGIGAFLMPPPGYFPHTALLTNVVFKGNAPSLGPTNDLSLLFEKCLGVTVYYLPGTMGWGATFGERPAKLWNPQVQTQDVSFGVQQGMFGFNIRGTAEIPFVIEATTNAAAGTWVYVQSSALNRDGFTYFSDPQWTNYPNRFYRIRSP